MIFYVVLADAKDDEDNEDAVRDEGDETEGHISAFLKAFLILFVFSVVSRSNRELLSPRKEGELQSLTQTI
jgi:hypothetical protein